jgi:outer membrane protein, heavy metal efflux system
LFNRILCFILVLACSWSFLPAQAESVSSLTLDHALELGITQNPQIKAAQAREGFSDAEIMTTAARLNPSLISDNGIAEDTYRLGIEQTVRLGGKRQKRVAVAVAKKEAVLADIQTTILNLRQNIRKAYTHLYSLQARQVRFQEILETNIRLLDIARKREEAGDIAQLDVLQAEIVVLNTQNDSTKLSQQLIQARNILSMLLNQPLALSVSLMPPNIASPTVQPYLKPGNGIALRGNVSQEDVAIDSLLDQALQNRPELQENAAQIQVTERQLSLATANRIPDLTLAAGSDLVTGDNSQFSAFIIGRIDLPLFNRQQGPIQEALQRQTQLQQEQVSVKNQISLEVANAYSAFLLNQEQLKRYEAEILPKAQEVVTKSQRSFEVGKSTILMPLTAQQSFMNAQIGYLQALADYQNAISDLERAVGTEK